MKRFPLMLSFIAVGVVLIVALRFAEGRRAEPVRLFPADDPRIRYMGRVDTTNRKAPRLHSSGATVMARFRGSSCEVVINDEYRWNKNRNFLTVVVDNGKPVRVQTTGKTDTISIAKDLSPGVHTVTICKDTEAGIGYVEVVGFRCVGLESLPAKPKHRLEFFGDSITCGAESDLSVSPCSKGEWYDRHNAYGSYGAVTARRLNAEYILTSRSGIGLMHSCCDMKQVMPDVWDTLDMETPAKKWDTRRFQPEAVMVCLGQNDGEQEPEAFCAAYVAFLTRLRTAYPKARIICLTSPMGNESLRKYQKAVLTQVIADRKRLNDMNVTAFAFANVYNGGCGGHPNVTDHAAIAGELSTYLKETMSW